MKKYFIFLLLCFAIVSIYSQEIPLLENGTYKEWNINGTGLIRCVEISDNNRIKFDYLNDIYKNGSYVISNEYGINFLTVLWDNETQEKYLLITGEGLCFLYNSDDRPFFAGALEIIWYGRYGGIENEYLAGYPVAFADDIDASSALIEGNVFYFTENLDERIGVCWAEGVRGQGINEIIKMGFPAYNHNPGYISIGFVSYEKPHLYRENSRPKKIGIYKGYKLIETIELEDTPNFQNINVDEVGLVILEVYEGKKYQDTCINSILYDSRSANK